MLISFHPIISMPQIQKCKCFLVAFYGSPARPPTLFPSCSGQSSQPLLTFSSSSLWVKLSWTLKTIFWRAAGIRKVVFKLGYDPRSWCTKTTTTTAVQAGQQNHIQRQIIWLKTRKQKKFCNSKSVPFALLYCLVIGEMSSLNREVELKWLSSTNRPTLLSALAFLFTQKIFKLKTQCKIWLQIEAIES